MAKTKKYKYYKDQLDKVFSEFIRKRDCPAKCFTCYKMLDYKTAQAGHYITRGALATRWDERNVQIQCAGDNLYKKGSPDEFALALIEKYGTSILEELNQLKHSQVKFSKHDLIDKIEEYKLKIKNL